MNNETLFVKTRQIENVLDNWKIAIQAAVNLLSIK